MPNEPVWAWTKMTSETPPMPNGRRATIEAVERATTWGAASTRAHGPRPLSGVVDSEYIFVRTPDLDYLSEGDERLPPPLPIRRRDDGAVRRDDLGRVGPRAGVARLLDPVRARPFRRGLRPDRGGGHRRRRRHPPARPHRPP